MSDVLPSAGFERSLYQVATLASVEPTGADLLSLQAGLVLQTLDSLTRPATPEEVRDAIHRDLGIAISVDAIVRAIDRLRNAHELTDGPNLSVSLEQATKLRLTDQAAATWRLKADVIREWLDSIDADLQARRERPLNAIQRINFESDLQIFLLQLVRYHGAEVVAFLYPHSGPRAVLEIDEPSLFAELPDRETWVRELRRAALPVFVREAAGPRAAYIADLLHRATLLQILQADASAAALFANGFNQPTIFLDTNFIFRLLGLQGELLRQAARDVLTNGRAFARDFRISRRTLEEFELVVERQNDWLTGDDEIPEVLGDVASAFVPGNDYVAAFWRDRRRHRITAKQFSERYAQVRLLLESDGITVDPSLHEEVLGSADFIEATQILRTFKPGEPVPRVEHDAFHKVLIEHLRSKRDNLPPAGWHDAGFLFLTFDNTLPPYAAHLAAKRKGHRIPFCLMANEWLQIIHFLRPSAQIRPDVFVALLNSPYLERYFSARVVNRDIVRSVMLTLGQLGELRPEVARKILVDRVLTQALESTKDAHKQRELIKQAVRRSAAEEDRRLEVLQQQVRAKEARIAELESRLAALERRPSQTSRPVGDAGAKASRREKEFKEELAKSSKEMATLKKRLGDSEQQTTALGAKIDELQAATARRVSLTRFVIRAVVLPAVVVVTLGLLVVFASGAQRPRLLIVSSAVLVTFVFIWSRFIQRLAKSKALDSPVFDRTFLVAKLVMWLLTLGGLLKHLLSHFIWEQFLKDVLHK